MTVFISELVVLTIFACQSLCQLVRSSDTFCVTFRWCLVNCVKFNTHEGFLLNLLTTDINCWVNSNTKIVFTNSFSSCSVVPWSWLESINRTIFKFSHHVSWIDIDKSFIVFLSCDEFKNIHTSFVTPVSTFHIFTVRTKECVTNWKEERTSYISVNFFQVATKFSFRSDCFIWFHIFFIKFRFVVVCNLSFDTVWEGVSFTFVLSTYSSLFSILLSNFFWVLLWDFLDSSSVYQFTELVMWKWEDICSSRSVLSQVFLSIWIFHFNHINFVTRFLFKLCYCIWVRFLSTSWYPKFQSLAIWTWALAWIWATSYQERPSHEKSSTTK